MGYEGRQPQQDSEAEVGIDALRDKLTSRRFRLSNLYKVKDDTGKISDFKPFATQAMLYDDLKPKNCILKGRQMRVTTAYCTMWLDAALFNNEGLSIGIIAHTKGDASKIFKNKICAPYDHLLDEIRNAPGNRVIKRTESEIGFENGANISVGVSFRSGNLQVLHVTEYGYICARQPLRAEEIKTGAFIAAQRGITVVESTALGTGGDFARICQESQKDPSSLWHFKFLPWYLEPTYTVAAEGPFREHREGETDYLDKLQAQVKVKLTQGQRKWWCLMRREYGEKMFSEFPSTPEEAFKASTEGAYYGAQMLAAWREGRVTEVPIDPTLPVETWWDIGFGDSTSIWFVQRRGMRVFFVDYYENSGEGVSHYAQHINQWKLDNKVQSSIRCVGPHDLDQGRWSTGKTQLESAAEHGLRFEVVGRTSISDGIEAVRRALPMCIFDETRCSDGIHKMERYKKRWNNSLSVWSDEPLHDDASHCADAFRTGVLGMSLKPAFEGVASTPRSPARQIVPVKWK